MDEIEELLFWVTGAVEATGGGAVEAATAAANGLLVDPVLGLREKVKGGTSEPPNSKELAEDLVGVTG